MAEHPVPRAPQGGKPGGASKAAPEETPLTPKQQQALAHQRGRICKVRGCEICAPRREARRLKKAERKMAAQAQAHARGEPCGRSNCPIPICVTARHADDPSTVPEPPRGGATEDADAIRRRQSDRHRAGLPCGVETCPNAECIDAFALERARRHRARRPCKSIDCTNDVCVASRSGA